jgi:hypothetical protein
MYHSHQISGATYDSNDLEEFRAGLRTIRRLGLRIVPGTWFAEWLRGADYTPGRALAGK